jgi:hypothetical protein
LVFKGFLMVVWYCRWTSYDRGYDAGNASLITLFARFLGAALRGIPLLMYAEQLPLRRMMM